MLNQQVACTDLAISALAIHRLGFDLRSAVVLSHVALELLGIGSLRRLPSRLFLGFVEIVGEVLGLRVADFPAGWETCVSLCCG